MPPTPRVGKLSPSQLKAKGFGPRSERYHAPPGHPAAVKGTISRRQAENERYVAGGWRGRADFERRYQGKMGRRFAKFEEVAIEEGKNGGRRVGPSGEFAKLWNRYRARPSDRRPTGPLAKLLVYLDLREPDWSFAVGSTPPKGH